MNPISIRSLLLGSALVAALATDAAAKPIATFECREITGRDWARTLVTYDLANAGVRKPSAALRLVDAATSNEVPFQIWHNGTRISFYAELKKGGQYRFELWPGKPAKLTAPPTVTTRDRVVTLDNGLTALRLPAGKQTFKTPLALRGEQAQAGTAFGPIAGIRLADGKWVGGSYFSYEPIDAVRLRQQWIKELPADAWARATQAAPKVTAYETTVTERGPLFAEARIRFTFSNGGYYQLTARILANDPAVRVDETMDLVTTSQPDDPLYVNILLGDGRADGWRPDCLFGYNPHTNALDATFEQLTQVPATNAIPFLRPLSMALTYAQDGQIVGDVTATYPWQSFLHYFGVVQRAALAKDKAAPFLAVVPQHAGAWRGAAFVFPPKDPQLYNSLLTYTNGDLALRWNIRNQPHVQNLLHTGEYDPAFGLTGMRRVWNLVGGPFQSHNTLHPMRAVEGFVNLDHYKDWVLAWSDDTRAGVELPVAGREPLTHFHEAFWGGDERGNTWFSHYRHAERMAWAVEARKQLADPKLSAAEKGRLRAQIAAFCFMMADPDFNTRASATHQGNPSMPVNRFFALPFAAVLIPDHPQAKVWLDTSREYLAYKLGMNVAPGGGYSELMTYFMAGAPTYVHGALVMKETGRLDEPTRRLALGPVNFALSALPPPDPRFGYRMIPGFGHEGGLHGDLWRPAAALIKDADPDRAAVYAWAWKEQGGPGEFQHCNGFSLLHADEGKLAANVKPAAIREALASAWIPGFGAVLHSHPGDPQETYFAYRQGYLTSHSDANQGDFVLFAKGAPLTTVSLAGYAISVIPDYVKSYKEFGWHSNVRIGNQQNHGGWPGGGPVSGVHRHYFSDSADYLRGMGDYSAVVMPGVDIGRDLTAPDAQRWTRQILFLKGKTPASPNYLVFRDSFANLRGDASKLTPKWWYQRTLRAKDQVQANAAGFHYTSKFGPQLDVHFLQPASVTIESRTADGPDTPANATIGGGGLGEPAKHPYAGGREQFTINAVGPVAAGQDILVALYPQGKDEPAPKYEALAEGVAKITTAESADYVFLNPNGVDYKQGDVAFQGKAGAVRVYPDAVHLIVTEGAGTVTYQGCTLKAGKPVTKIVPIADIAKGGTIEVPADPVTIQFAFDAKAGAITDVQPGVKKQTLPNGVAYLFDSAEPIHFASDGAVFDGKRGGILVDTKAGTTRLVMFEGTRIGYRDALAEVADGPYDLTFTDSKVLGTVEGPARLLHISRPAGLKTMPGLTMDGARYCPGGYTGVDPAYCQHLNPYDSVIALRGGRQTFTLEELPQPSVFRSWEMPEHTKRTGTH